MNNRAKPDKIHADPQDSIIKFTSQLTTAGKSEEIFEEQT